LNKEELERIEWRKVLRVIKLPAILVIYGWIGFALLGLWAKTLVELDLLQSMHPIIRSIATLILFLIPALAWLYTWRKIAKHYRDKHLR